jgi:hypothetical protein
VPAAPDVAVQPSTSWLAPQAVPELQTALSISSTQPGSGMNSLRLEEGAVVCFVTEDRSPGEDRGTKTRYLMKAEEQGRGGARLLVQGTLLSETTANNNKILHYPLSSAFVVERQV